MLCLIVLTALGAVTGATAVVTALLRDGKIAALREDWLFDEDFSATALSDVRQVRA